MKRILRSLAALLLLACLLVTPLLALADGPGHPYPPPPGGGDGNSIIELADGPGHPYPPPPGDGGGSNSTGNG